MVDCNLTDTYLITTFESIPAKLRKVMKPMMSEGLGHSSGGVLLIFCCWISSPHLTFLFFIFTPGVRFPNHPFPVPFLITRFFPESFFFDWTFLDFFVVDLVLTRFSGPAVVLEPIGPSMSDPSSSSLVFVVDMRRKMGSN